MIIIISYSQMEMNTAKAYNSTLIFPNEKNNLQE